MAEKKVEKCARPGCECPAAKGSKYCSPYCECGPSITCLTPASASIQSVLLAQQRVRLDGSIAKVPRSLQVCLLVCPRPAWSCLHGAVILSATRLKLTD